MTMLKLFSGLTLLTLSATAFNCFAGTTNVPVSCTWATQSVQSNPYGATVGDICVGDSPSTTIASRTRTFGSSQSCYLSTNAPYSDNGNCSSPSFQKTITTPDTSCGVNSGQAYGTVFVNNTSPFPVASINAYCGSCGYTTTVVNSGPNGAQLNVVCK